MGPTAGADGRDNGRGNHSTNKLAIIGRITLAYIARFNIGNFGA